MNHAPSERKPWHFTERMLFRFWGAHLSLYAFFNWFEFSDVWTLIVAHMAAWLHIAGPVSFERNGSGDALFDYLQVLCLLILAAFLTLIWSLFDHKRKEYDKLLYLVSTFLRYTLAFMLISYGMNKVLQLQFPPPYLKRLLQPYGDSSPMGLAWTFMGYSKAFNLFTGLAEVVGGLLLFFRKTSTFGALFSMTVLSNIVALNFCYDIPVKLFSMHLLAMAIFIASADVKRLLLFFFSNKPVPPGKTYPFEHARWVQITKLCLKTLVICGIIYSQVSGAIYLYRDYGPEAPRPLLYGIYNVDTFSTWSAGGYIPSPPLTTDTLRWKQLVLDRSVGFVRTMDDKFHRMEYDIDTAKSAIYVTMNDKKDSALYLRPDTSRLILDGVFQGARIKAILHKKDPNGFLLLNRGFHWINETPYNK